MSLGAFAAGSAPLFECTNRFAILQFKNFNRSIICHLRMHRPTRTLRLSVAAIVSLLAFVVAAAAGMRSFWISDTLIFAFCQSEIVLSSGCVTCARIKSVGMEGFDRSKHLSDRVAPDKHNIARAIWGFRAWRIVLPHRSGVREEISALEAPLWSLLLLLIIAPARWLLARPANAPAFPIIAETCRSAAASRT